MNTKQDKLNEKYKQRAFDIWEEGKNWTAMSCLIDELLESRLSLLEEVERFIQEEIQSAKEEVLQAVLDDIKGEDFMNHIILQSKRDTLGSIDMRWRAGFTQGMTYMYEELFELLNNHYRQACKSSQKPPNPSSKQLESRFSLFEELEREVQKVKEETLKAVGLKYDNSGGEYERGYNTAVNHLDSLKSIINKK